MDQVVNACKDFSATASTLREALEVAGPGQQRVKDPFSQLRELFCPAVRAALGCTAVVEDDSKGAAMLQSIIQQLNQEWADCRAVVWRWVLLSRSSQVFNKLDLPSILSKMLSTLNCSVQAIDGLMMDFNSKSTSADRSVITAQLIPAIDDVLRELAHLETIMAGDRQRVRQHAKAHAAAQQLMTCGLDDPVWRKALRFIAKNMWSCRQWVQQVLIGFNVIPCIIPHIRVSDDTTHSLILESLSTFAQFDSLLSKLLEVGYASELVTTLNSNSSSSERKLAAVMALDSLAGRPNTQAALIAAGAIPALGRVYTGHASGTVDSNLVSGAGILIGLCTRLGLNDAESLELVNNALSVLLDAVEYSTMETQIHACEVLNKINWEEHGVVAPHMQARVSSTLLGLIQRASKMDCNSDEPNQEPIQCDDNGVAHHHLHEGQGSDDRCDLKDDGKKNPADNDDGGHADVVASMADVNSKPSTDSKMPDVDDSNESNLKPIPKIDRNGCTHDQPLDRRRAEQRLSSLIACVAKLLNEPSLVDAFNQQGGLEIVLRTLERYNTAGQWAGSSRVPDVVVMFLQDYFCDTSAHKQMLLAAGAVQTLVSVLRVSADARQSDNVARLLFDLVTEDPPSLQLIVYGGMLHVFAGHCFEEFMFEDEEAEEVKEESAKQYEQLDGQRAVPAVLQEKQEDMQTCVEDVVPEEIAQEDVVQEANAQEVVDKLNAGETSRGKKARTIRDEELRMTHDLREGEDASGDSKKRGCTEVRLCLKAAGRSDASSSTVVDKDDNSMPFETLDVGLGQDTQEPAGGHEELAGGEHDTKEALSTEGCVQGNSLPHPSQRDTMPTDGTDSRGVGGAGDLHAEEEEAQGAGEDGDYDEDGEEEDDPLEKAGNEAARRILEACSTRSHELVGLISERAAYIIENDTNEIIVYNELIDLDERKKELQRLLTLFIIVCDSHPACRPVAMQAGAIPALIKVFGCCYERYGSEIQDITAWAFAHFINDDPRVLHMLSDAGSLHAVAAALHAASKQDQELSQTKTARKALSSIMDVCARDVSGLLRFISHAQLSIVDFRTEQGQYIENIGLIHTHGNKLMCRLMSLLRSLLKRSDGGSFRAAAAQAGLIPKLLSVFEEDPRHDSDELAWTVAYACQLDPTWREAAMKAGPLLHHVAQCSMRRVRWTHDQELIDASEALQQMCVETGCEKCLKRKREVMEAQGGAADLCTAAE